MQISNAKNTRTARSEGAPIAEAATRVVGPVAEIVVGLGVLGLRAFGRAGRGRGGGDYEGEEEDREWVEEMHGRRRWVGGWNDGEGRWKSKGKGKGGGWRNYTHRSTE